jgi:hypothetical protein
MCPIVNRLGRPGRGTDVPDLSVPPDELDIDAANWAGAQALEADAPRVVVPDMARLGGAEIVRRCATTMDLADA